jgi:hypothetical protein
MHRKSDELNKTARVENWRRSSAPSPSTLPGAKVSPRSLRSRSSILQRWVGRTGTTDRA